MAPIDQNGSVEGETLAALVHELKARCDRLEQDNAELRASVRGLASGEAAPPRRKELSRREMLRGAAGIAAAAAGVGIVLEQAGPAAAADGASVTAGSTTTAEQSTTLAYDGSTTLDGVVFLANDSPYSASASVYPAALGGWAGDGTTGGKVPNGIYGYTNNGAGNAVIGFNASASGAGNAVRGLSQSTADSAAAVVGVMESVDPGALSAGVRGQNSGTGGNGSGVWGSHDGSGNGVYATSGSGNGLEATGAIGVDALGTALFGVQASGTLAPLRLVPAASTGAPTSGEHALGEVYVDSAGVFYRCVAAGVPGTWAAMNAVELLSSPKRAYSSTDVGGGAPMNQGETRTITIAGAVAGVPSEARGMIANLTVHGTVGGGYLTVYPAGSAQPATSSINWSTSGQTIANGITISLGTGGKISIYANAGVAAGTPATQVIVDVTGYVI